MALSEAEPSNTETREILLRSYEASGEMHRRMSDFAPALETFHEALVLLESWATAEPENLKVHRLLAIENANIARVHETAALDRKSSIARQRAGWRGSAGVVSSQPNRNQLSARGPLSEADTTTLAELSNEIAKCDLALSQR